jgi:hypothetical protein
LSATTISPVPLALVTDTVTGDRGGVCCAALAIRVQLTAVLA